MIRPAHLEAIRSRDARYPAGKITNALGSEVPALNDRRHLLDALDETLADLCIAQAQLDVIRSLCAPSRSGVWPMVGRRTLLAVLDGPPSGTS